MMINRGLRQILFAGYYRATRRGDVLDNVARHEALYRSNRSTIEHANAARLAATLSHASRTVPFYRELLAGRTVDASTASEILATLPAITKRTIRQHGKQLVSEVPGERVKTNSSGGSTGEPIKLLQDREMAQASRTGELMMMEWAGHRRGEPHVLIWGVPEAAFGERVPLREHLFRLVHNETYLNCYRITEDLLQHWTDVLNKRAPTLIEAYVEALHELSAYVLRKGLAIHSPRGIIVSAGVLTDDAQATISRAFRAPIINRYGSREVSNVACSCGVSPGLHVNEAWCLVEIVDESGNPTPVGVEGDVLVTLYHNRTMPLIRYRIEDRATWATDGCECGRNTRRLAAVNGRRNEYLVASDGTRIDGVAISTYTALSTLVHAQNGIQRFQYRQTRKGHVTLAVVPNERAEPEVLRHGLQVAVQKLNRLFSGIQVEIAIEREILPSASGKFRFVLSDIHGNDGRR